MSRIHCANSKSPKNCYFNGKLFFFSSFSLIYLCRFSLIYFTWNYLFLNITFDIIDRGSLWHFEECSSLRVQLPWQDQSEGQGRNDDLFPDRPKGTIHILRKHSKGGGGLEKGKFCFVLVKGRGVQKTWKGAYVIYERSKGHCNHARRWPFATASTTASILCQSDTSQSNDQPTSPATSSILKYRISKL